MMRMGIIASAYLGLISSNAIALGFESSPYIALFGFSTAGGFGTRASNPSSPPSNVVRGALAFSGTDLIVPDGGTTPFVAAWPVSPAGFGTRRAGPSTPPAGATVSATESPSGNAVVTGGNTSPYLEAWQYSSGFGTKYANPATAAGALVSGLAFHPSGNYLLSNRSGGVDLYDWSHAGGFGTKRTSPASTSGIQAAWHPSGVDMICHASATDYANALPFSGGSFGTRYANPATALTTSVNTFGFSASGAAVFMANNSAGQPFIAYRYTAGIGYGTKYSDPGTPPTGLTYTTGVSADGAAIFVGQSGTPFINVYGWTDLGGFGSRYANAASPITNSCRAARFLAL